MSESRSTEASVEALIGQMTAMFGLLRQNAADPEVKHHVIRAGREFVGAGRALLDIVESYLDSADANGDRP